MLEMARRAAARRIKAGDRAVVTRRPGGVGVYDPDTLKTALPAAETVYAGPAFYSDRLSGHPRDTGHADLREHHGVVRFPSPSAAVEVDDEIRFVDGPCEGMTFTVKAILNQTSELSRRVAVFRDDPEVMHS